MRQYLDLIESVLSEGVRKENRTGVPTLSRFGVFYKTNLQEGFPLLTTKEVSWKNILVENLWFLTGEPHIGFLRRHDCRFWEPWADEEGRVPSAYGHLWRRFPIPDPVGSNGCPANLDQISWVVDELKRNPDSRRLVVNAWAPGNACFSSLPPCHYSFVLNVQNDRLNLHMTQRSCDSALGLPYNLAGYAFLLELFSRFSGIPAGEFAHSIVDCHVYENHIDGLEEQLSREPLKLPRLKIDDRVKTLEDVEAAARDAGTDELLDLFKIEGYEHHPTIKFEVAV